MPGYIPFTRLSYLRGAIRFLHLCLSDLLLSGDDPDFPARQWAHSDGYPRLRPNPPNPPQTHHPRRLRGVRT